jgi:uncharacterized protein (TIGR03437 family)
MRYCMLLSAIALLPCGCLPAHAQEFCRLVSAADYKEGMVASGGLATLFCTGLTGIQGVQAATGFPLPYELAGVRVKVAGIDAPILAVADFGAYQQVNFQNPVETDDKNVLGSYRIELTQRGLRFPAGDSRIGPSLFRDANGFALAQHASDYSPVTRENPARAGEYIILYGTGITNYSNVRNAPPFGMPAPLEPLAWTPPETDRFVLIRGPFMTLYPPDETSTFISFTWVGLLPGSVGVFQMNFKMPDKVTTGRYQLGVRRAYEEIPPWPLTRRIHTVGNALASLWVAE